MATQDKKNNQAMSLEARLEALLFVAPGTVSVAQLATALEVTPRQVEKSLEALEVGYAQGGLRLQKHKGALRLTSAPQAAELVERFLDLEATQRLSAAALECLSIIAYQQPVTRPDIDSVRGVNSDSVLRTLLSNGLIEEAGREEGPGRPILYVTTPEFLQNFGIGALEDLPPLNLEELLADPEAHENNNGSELLKT